MRLRGSFSGTDLTWIGLAILQIGMTVDRLRRELAHGRHGRARLDEVALVLWGLILIHYLVQVFFSRVDVEEDALRIRRGFLSKKISYATIVAIRTAVNDSGKPIRNGLELEIARLGAAIYPHSYVVLRAPERRILAEAVHQRVPHASYELA